MSISKNQRNSSKPAEISLVFNHPLRTILPPAIRSKKFINHTLERRTSIKDLIESFDIPHTEVGAIWINGIERNFSYLVCEGDDIEVLGHAIPVDPCRRTYLRPSALPSLRFLVDINVAKLGTYLRMIGMDTLYQPQMEDKRLAELAVEEQCVVLSRDRGLLRRKIITHGHLVRSQNPVRQLAEIIDHYGLREKIRPFTRCIQCNGVLQAVTKEEIVEQLEPLTIKYYDEFSRCVSCKRIYWPGSHRDAMEKVIKKAVRTENRL